MRGNRCDVGSVHKKAFLRSNIRSMRDSGPIRRSARRFEMVAVAASTGGIQALRALVAARPRRRRGLVLVRDPATCMAPQMPQAVLAGGGADFVLPVPTLAHALVSLVMAPSVSTALFGLPALPVPRAS
jgi:chemotaxis response regulator CheB